MNKKEEKKAIQSGVYAVEAIETEELREQMVLPYPDIVKALNTGKAYVLPQGINRSTVKQSLTRVSKKVNKDVQFVLRKIKDTGQFCYVPVS